MDRNVKNMNLYLDYETASVIDLATRGLDIYSRDPSTRVLMASYAIDDGPIKLWQPHLNPEPPADLVAALEDPFTTLWAWNTTFERVITRVCLGIDKPIEETRDIMAISRYLSLPGDLGDVCQIQKVPSAFAKIKDGDRLIKKFCEPESMGESGLMGSTGPSFRNWITDPEDWKKFGDYCIRDLKSERYQLQRFSKFMPPDSEWRAWEFGERVNETGWPVDELLVSNASGIVTTEIGPLLDRLRELSGLQNPNSRDQALSWLQERGYGFSSLGKAFVNRALRGENDLTKDAKEFLAIRAQTAKNSVAKYNTISEQMGPDARLRYQYTFYGAHTGRYAAHGVNVGNLPRPDKAVEKNLELAVNLVRANDLEEIRRKFGKPIDVASGVLRSAFRAPKGKKLVVADYNAVENRGLGYIARCQAILDVFRRGLDPYIAFAAKLYKLPYEEILAQHKAGNSQMRTYAKPAVLGAGYQLSAGQEFEDEETGEKNWSGLMGYARNMGIELTEEFCVMAIRAFREEYEEVRWLWKDFERSAAWSIRHPGEIVPVGIPLTEKDAAWYNDKGRTIHEKPVVSFKTTGSRVLEMLLPSGRSLFYLDPKVVRETKKWEDREYEQDCVYYMGKDSKTKQWSQQSSFGGFWTENADQSICRDVLIHGMLKADEAGFEVIGSTYDEVICLADANGSLGSDELCACLTQSPPWLDPNEFPLAAEGFESDVYRK
jgi:DNA polymerase